MVYECWRNADVLHRFFMSCLSVFQTRFTLVFDGDWNNANVGHVRFRTMADIRDVPNLRVENEWNVSHGFETACPNSTAGTVVSFRVPFLECRKTARREMVSTSGGNHLEGHGEGDSSRARVGHILSTPKRPIIIIARYPQGRERAVRLVCFSPSGER
jgi:hypothetical protein